MKRTLRHSLIKEVHDKHWAKSLDRAEKAQEMLKLAALHQLLPETLQSDVLGTPFTQLVRHRRELFYPIGEHSIKPVRSTTGLIFNVNLGDHFGCDLYYGLFNEQAEYALFNALIRPGDLVVDVGANFGLYSLLGALRTESSGRVVAFEPEHSALKLLRENIKLNSLEDQIDLQPICVGSYNGMTSFHEAEQSSFSGIIDTGRSTVSSVTEVPIRRLDDILSERGISAISFLKIDVEGTEAHVLEGAMVTLEKSGPVIALEISPKNNSSAELDEMLSRLTLLKEQLGYVAYCISRDRTKLVRFRAMRDIFDDSAFIRRNNYFLVPETSEKARLMESTFATLQRSILNPNHFFNNWFSARLSPDQIRAQYWAERERGMLAMEQADRAYKHKVNYDK